MDLLAIITKIQDVAGFIMMILAGLIGISLMIPGEQPEKALQAALDFIKKFSKK